MGEFDVSNLTKGELEQYALERVEVDANVRTQSAIDKVIEKLQADPDLQSLSNQLIAEAISRGLKSTADLPVENIAERIRVFRARSKTE